MKNIIVFVDDDSSLRKVISEVLTKAKFKVYSFAKAEEAKSFLLKYENKNELLAVVSDLMMGPTDGLDFLSDIKSTPSLQQLDFFLMTGAAVSVFKPFIKPLILKGVIEKPIKAKDLIEVFTRLQSEKEAPIKAA